MTLRFAVLSLVASVSLNAGTYSYANWTSATGSNGGTNGSASGTISTPQGTLSISYSGDLVTTPTQLNNMGTDYYSSWQSVYTSSTVSNSPTNVDVIALSEAYSYTDTITFSKAVINPIIDIVSLGEAPIKATVSYNFSATPTILSQGPAYWPGGCTTCLSVTGNTLNGLEGDGTVEFVGTFSSISWTTTGGEYWNGFTVGVLGESLATPEPGTVWLLGIAVGLGAAVRRFRS